MCRRCGWRVRSERRLVGLTIFNLSNDAVGNGEHLSAVSDPVLVHRGSEITPDRLPRWIESHEVHGKSLRDGDAPIQCQQTSPMMGSMVPGAVGHQPVATSYGCSENRRGLRAHVDSHTVHELLGTFVGAEDQTVSQ